MRILKDILEEFDKSIYLEGRTINDAAKNTPNDGGTDVPTPNPIQESASIPEPILLQRLDRTHSMFSQQANDYLVARDLTPCKDLPLFLALTLRSLGIIFGDIGTSPLYVVSTIFTDEPTEIQLIGALSLVIWSLIIFVTIKYGIFILMADNNGEGGTFALCGLLTGEQSTLGPRAKKAVTIVALIAASMLIGDGALTPAVSVLSAIEGIAVEAPNLQSWIVPITVIILIILFLAQRFGTSKIGVTFGPIMIVWFGTLFAIGIWQITYQPSILRAFNPWEALQYLIREKGTGFDQIGGVFLAVTGLEALYADLGHFGRWPIRTSWFFIVFPAVTANYLGQGALLIGNSTLIDNPFYHSVPDWGHWPMVVLATMATLIASQAIITGSFSLISQAVALQCSVPFKIIHTSKKIAGQIYVPAINFILMILTIAVTAGFQTGSSITNAYGVTVCSVMIITTVLYMCVMHFTWHKKIYLILPFGLFLIMDSFTWAANSIKIPNGGWVAIVIGTCASILSFSWYFGELQLRRFLKMHAPTTQLQTLALRLNLVNSHYQSYSRNSIPELPVIVTANQNDMLNESDSDSDTDFKTNDTGGLSRAQSRIILIKNLSIASSYNMPPDFQSTDPNMRCIIPAVITPGVGCFLTTSKKYTPHVFENFLFRMHAVPQVVIFLQVEFAKTSTVENEKRIIVRAYGENIYHITALYGYSENQIQPFDILLLARTLFGVPIPDDEMKITLFMGNEKIKVSTIGWRSWIRRWPLFIYAILKSLYPGAAMNIKINPENTIHVGILAKLE
jgi:KUP system potassium uptake protein